MDTCRRWKSRVYLGTNGDAFNKEVGNKKSDSL